tara:strand:- start:616 stop:2784 length:2169 start_codon:yes stop_codon:yes gene_type:complete
MGGRNPQGTPKPLQEQMPPAKAKHLKKIDDTTIIDPWAPIGSVKPTPDVSPIPKWEPNPEDPLLDYEQKMEWLQFPDYEHSTEGQAVLQWMDSPEGQDFQKMAHGPDPFEVDSKYGFKEGDFVDNKLSRVGSPSPFNVMKEIKQLDPDSPLKWTNPGGVWQVYDPVEGTTIGIDELKKIRDDLLADVGLEEEFDAPPQTFAQKWIDERVLGEQPQQDRGASLLNKGLDLATYLPWGKAIKIARKVPWGKLIPRMKEQVRQFRLRNDPRIKAKKEELAVQNTERLKRAKEQGYDLDDEVVHILRAYEVVRRGRDAQRQLVPEFDSEGKVKKDQRTYGAFDPDRKTKWTGSKWMKVSGGRGYIFFGEDIIKSNEAAQEASWDHHILEDIESWEERYNTSWDDFAERYPEMLKYNVPSREKSYRMINEFQKMQTRMRSQVAVQRAVIRGPVAGREIHVPSSIMELPEEVTLNEYQAMLDKADKFDYTSLGEKVNPKLARRLVKTNIKLAYSKFTENPTTGGIYIQAPDDDNRRYYTFREVLADEELKKRAFPENYDDLTEDDFSDVLDSPMTGLSHFPKGKEIKLKRNKKLTLKMQKTIINDRNPFGDDFEFLPGYSPIESRKDLAGGGSRIPYRDTLEALGFTGTKLWDEAGISTAVLDPSAIRAPWAKFDEKKKHSNNILVSLLLGGLITKGQLARLKRESEPQKRTETKKPAKRKREGRRTR